VARSDQAARYRSGRANCASQAESAGFAASSVSTTPRRENGSSPAASDGGSEWSSMSLYVSWNHAIASMLASSSPSRSR
jgi:hypothetical protein